MGGSSARMAAAGALAVFLLLGNLAATPAAAVVVPRRLLLADHGGGGGGGGRRCVQEVPADPNVGRATALGGRMGRFRPPSPQAAWTRHSEGRNAPPSTIV
ncbi:hypothetical protein Taro_018351 [Colocasia esculenta]|uniref:Uncharacterized protein n=1 Tax=Colocasia esculenta TaxID=4460 RepID=A0A843UTK8_COLES|nr:hypothetical protein [Colocasia esculenta]